MQDLRLLFPGQMEWLAEALQDTRLVGPVTYDSESLLEWCEGEALDFPIRVNARRALHPGETTGEITIEAPVFVRLFLRFGEPISTEELNQFAKLLARKLAETTHRQVDVGTIGYDGGDDFSFAVGETMTPTHT